MIDLISRQMAIDAMRELPYGYRGIVWGILNSLPSAQPTIDAVEVKHGEWIEADDLEGAIKGVVVCSNCKNLFQSIVMTSGKIILTNQKTKYCPNCGAKMDGERREK